MSLEGEDSRRDQGDLDGEDQPYDQGRFEHSHNTHQPRAVYGDIRTDPLVHDGRAGSRLVWCLRRGDDK